MDLTDDLWAAVQPLIPNPPLRVGGKGWPRVFNRRILDGILWILRTGAPWKELPETYPPYQTCHRRYQEWVKAGAFESILKALVKDMKVRGDLDLTVCFIYDTLLMEKKGVTVLKKPGRSKARKSWQRLVAHLTSFENKGGSKLNPPSPYDVTASSEYSILTPPSHSSPGSSAGPRPGRAARRYGKPASAAG